MDITVNKLFIYEKVYQLLFSDAGNYCFTKDNGPMYKQPIKIHKGINNSVKFRVFDPDKCPMNISNLSISVRMIQSETKLTVLESQCQRSSIKGVFSATFDSNDINHLPTGCYNIVFLVSNDDTNYNYPMYTDYSNNIQLQVELTDQGQRDPRPEYVVTEWTQVSNVPYGPIITSYESSNVPSASTLNSQGDQCTFSVQTQGFTGNLKVYGTLSHIPNQSLDEWYKVEISPGKNTIEFINYTGTDYFTFSERSMWYKFVYTPDDSVVDPGIFQKLIVRV